MLNDDLDDVGHLSTSLLGSTKASPKYFNPQTKHVGQWEIIPGGMEKTAWIALNWWEKRVKPLQFCPKPLLGKNSWNSTGCGVSLAIFWWTSLHAPPNAQQHSKHWCQLPRRRTSLCWHEGNQHLAVLLSTKTHRSFQRSETASGCLYIIGKCVQMPWFPGTKFFNQF